MRGGTLTTGVYADR